MAGPIYRRAKVDDAQELAVLLLESCAQDELHLLLEPRQSHFPKDTHKVVFRGIRDKLLNDSYLVEVVEDEHGRILAMAAWNLQKIRCQSWCSWARTWIAAWMDRGEDLAWGRSRSTNFGLLEELEIASRQMLDRHCLEDTVELAQLAVSPTAQRRGHGSILVSRRLAEYRSIIVASSRIAEPFYERLGFEKVGQIRVTNYEAWWFKREMRAVGAT